MRKRAKRANRGALPAEAEALKAEAAAQEEPEAPPSLSGGGTPDPAEDTAEDQTHVGGEDEAPAGDEEANEGELPDGESLPEEGDGEPDERGPDDPPPVVEVDDKEPTLADDKRAGAVDPETGEPKDNPLMFSAALDDPGAFSPEDVGAMIIKGLDRLALCLTREARTRQPELFQVLQLFAAERPSILERQKRLQLRQNQG